VPVPKCSHVTARIVTQNSCAWFAHSLRIHENGTTVVRRAKS